MRRDLPPFEFGLRRCPRCGAYRWIFLHVGMFGRGKVFDGPNGEQILTRACLACGGWWCVEPKEKP